MLEPLSMTIQSIKSNVLPSLVHGDLHTDIVCSSILYQDEWCILITSTSQIEMIETIANISTCVRFPFESGSSSKHESSPIKNITFHDRLRIVTCTYQFRHTDRQIENCAEAAARQRRDRMMHCWLRRALVQNILISNSMSWLVWKVFLHPDLLFRLVSAY